MIDTGIVHKIGKEGLLELKRLIISEYNKYEASMPATNLPSNITDHDIEPGFSYNGSTRELDSNVYQIKNLEKLTGVCDFIAEKIQSLGNYYIDTDNRDVYDGKKGKTMWCFILNDAQNELANDILDETTDYLMNRDSAKDILEMGLRNVMRKVNEGINNKITALLQAINSVL